MRASALEFRLRMIIIGGILVLGFWSPWIEPLHLGARTTTWLWLGFQLGGLHIASTWALALVNIAVIAVSAVAAAMRIWGAAYLGPNTVLNKKMIAGERVLADGPYRYIRNPLYGGTFLLCASIAVLMPPSGALVALLLLAIFILRLILGEETFLAGHLGDSYAAYRRSVPRLLPRLTWHVAAGGTRPNWTRALLGECFPLGVLLCFSALSWQYNAFLLDRALLIAFGASLVIRALALPGKDSIARG